MDLRRTCGGPSVYLLGAEYSSILVRAVDEILGMDTVLAEYQSHYNTARQHQGIVQRVRDGEHDDGHLAVADLDRERICRRPILGGLINEYSRVALPYEDTQAGPIFERDRFNQPGEVARY
jgi:hypothetical protein